MDAVPTLEVLDRDAMSQVAQDNWAASGLDGWDLPVEEWTSAASNRALQYATHGIFRYFGKFPPLVARRLICQFTRPGDLVLDPMIGSGTTAVEAGLLGRRCAALDVNPLGLLLTRVKCRRIAASRLRRRLAELLAAVSRRGLAEPPCPALWPTAVKTSHWFLPQTSHWLHVMRECIGALPDPAERDFFLAVYAGIIRRVSRATTQQGRLFLDAATAEPDPRPRFAAAAKDAIEAVASLDRNTPDVTVLQASAMDCDFSRWKAPLVICHPPYFNVYKYSGIFSLEMAWLGYEIQAIRRQEIREFFKVGKPEKVPHYVNDLSAALRNIARALAPGGVLALMMGDTTIHGNRIRTTKLVLDAIRDHLVPFQIAVRTPRFTEASWAASQRRNGQAIGIAVADFILLLRAAARQ